MNHLAVVTFLLLAIGTESLNFDVAIGYPTEKDVVEKNCNWIIKKQTCIEKVCGTHSTKLCVILFSKMIGSCYKLTTSSPVLMVWNPKQFLQKLLDYEVLFVNFPKSTDVPRPAGLWLLNSYSRYKNFGSTGLDMDLKATDDSLKWTAQGPPGASKTVLYRGTENNDFKSWIDFVKNGQKLIELSTGFTMTMWLKTEKSGKMYILLNDGQDGMDLLFWPDTDELRIGHQVTWLMSPSRTIKNSEGKNAWRHIAISYSGSGSPKVYLNGRIWPLRDVKTHSFHTPERLYLWFKKDYNFVGSRACFAIFEKSLSEAHVRYVMKNCF